MTSKETNSNDLSRTARKAGLRYVSDSEPGIQRKRAGRGFSYTGLDGKPVRDRDELKRIKALAIPPAYTDVWICPSPNGHIQATGRDVRGRKQYRYHELWRTVRDETKYNRMLDFGHVLPRIRERVDRDLSLRGMPRLKLLAIVVRLLDTTYIRIGNTEYARENKSFGLTTLRDRHVTISGSTLEFHFRGKSGKNHSITLTDRRLAKLVKKCKDIPGYQLFQYFDEDNQRQIIGSADVNEYLFETAGEHFTAKDFRTWGGTVIAATTLATYAPTDKKTEARSNIVQAIEQVSEHLGNTPAICRKCYIHPHIIEAYQDHSLFNYLPKRPPGAAKEPWLDDDEAAVLALLSDQASQAPRKRSA